MDFLLNKKAVYVWGNGNVLKYPKILKFSMKDIIEDHLLSNENSHINDIKFGEDTFYILTEGGNIFAAGLNNVGQLGDNSKISRTNFLKVDLNEV